VSGDRAVFLDRDGTLIDDVGYISDAEDVRLVPGAADALRALRTAGIRLVVAGGLCGGLRRGSRLGQLVGVRGAAIASPVTDAESDETHDEQVHPVPPVPLRLGQSGGGGSGEGGGGHELCSWGWWGFLGRVCDGLRTMSRR